MSFHIQINNSDSNKTTIWSGLVSEPEYNDLIHSRQKTTDWSSSLFRAYERCLAGGSSSDTSLHKFIKEKNVTDKVISDLVKLTGVHIDGSSSMRQDTKVIDWKMTSTSLNADLLGTCPKAIGSLIFKPQTGFARESGTSRTATLESNVLYRLKLEGLTSEDASAIVSRFKPANQPKV